MKQPKTTNASKSVTHSVAKADVFISYSSKDKAIADALVHFLESKKIRCWIAPRNITAGIEYAQAISGAIAKVSVVVLLYSIRSLKSKWCKSEVGLALSHGKTIVPFKIDNSDATDGWDLYLQTQHWIDAVPDPENKFGKIAEDIQVILGRGEDTRVKGLSSKRAAARLDTPSVSVTDRIRAAVEILKKVGDSDLYLRPNIPQKKLSNAMKSMLVKEALDDVSILIDTTVFGSAKDGIVVTGKSLYCKELMEEPLSFDIKALPEIYRRDSGISIGAYNINLAGWEKEDLENLYSALTLIRDGE